VFGARWAQKRALLSSAVARLSSFPAPDAGSADEPSARARDEESAGGMLDLGLFPAEYARGEKANLHFGDAGQPT
jgi:hypothetical protein